MAAFICSVSHFSPFNHSTKLTLGDKEETWYDKGPLTHSECPNLITIIATVS